MNTKKLFNNIIVIDNEKVITSTLQMFFELKGYNVTCISSPMDILKYLLHNQNNIPELIIAEYQMIGKTELDLLKKVNKKCNDKISLIIMSEYGERLPYMDNFMNSADDYIDKPLNLSHLYSRVKNIEQKYYE